MFVRSRPRNPSPASEIDMEQAAKVDRRFSTMFTSAAAAQPLQPQLTAPPGTAGQQQKDCSPHAARTESPSPSTNNTRIKMDRRFSTFLSLPSLSQANTPPRTPAQSIRSETISLYSRTCVRNVKGLLRRIFSTSNTITCTSNLSFEIENENENENENEKAETSIPEQLGERLWADVIGQSRPNTSPTPPASRPTTPTPGRRTVQRSTTVIVPAPSSTLRLKSRSRFSQALKGSGTKHGDKIGGEEVMEVVGILQSSGKKRGFGSGRTDSKFSSITSLPSVHSLSLPSLHAYSPTSHGTVTITAEGLKHLERGVRRIHRRLQHQEHLTTHLSNNLIHLFTRKESQITLLKRIRSDDKSTMLSSLSRIHESSGRTFLRKAVFLQRSRELVTQISSLLTTSTISTSFSPGEEVIIDDEVFDLLALLKEDLKTQRELDERLQNMVLLESKEKRWAGSPGERSLVRKFVGFVEGRMAALGNVYSGVEEVVRRCEGVERC